MNNESKKNEGRQILEHFMKKMIMQYLLLVVDGLYMAQQQ